MDLKMVSLTDLMGGAAVEAFDHELARAANNILDPNTLPTAVREIVLKVKIKPTADRELGAVEFSCDAKLAASKPLTSRLYFGMQQGKATVVEHDPKQPAFPEMTEPAKLRAVGGDVK